MPDQPQPDSNLQTWKLTLAYDGTDFQGWQIQPGLPTIQGKLQAALGRVTGESPLPQGSGRTDAGVHALAQVASFALRAPIPPGNLLRALNRTLPSSIRISETRTVPSTFHARHSAIAKTYEYRILRAADSPPFICPPFLARYVYACPWPLSLDALQAVARLFLGEHDFLSFAATDPDLGCRSSDQSMNLIPTNLVPMNRVHVQKETVRKIFTSIWEQRFTEAGELLIYRIRGNAFLHHMVRNLVGTMIDVGRGHLALEEIPRILAARSRFLHSVDYPPESPSEA
jgi:tRNA pseudouridine38-40 synthase